MARSPRMSALNDRRLPKAPVKRFSIRLGVEQLEDRATPAVLPDFAFVVPIGESSYIDQVEAVTHDASGNIYVAGFFNGTVDFDPSAGDTSLTVDNQSAFVAIYDSAGVFRWVQSVAPTGGQTAGTAGAFGHAIASDGTDVYLAGSITGTDSAGGSDFFVRKLDGDDGATL